MKKAGCLVWDTDILNVSRKITFIRNAPKYLTYARCLFYQIYTFTYTKYFLTPYKFKMYSFSLLPKFGRHPINVANSSMNGIQSTCIVWRVDSTNRVAIASFFALISIIIWFLFGKIVKPCKTLTVLKGSLLPAE